MNRNILTCLVLFWIFLLTSACLDKNDKKPAKIGQEIEFRRQKETAAPDISREKARQIDSLLAFYRKKRRFNGNVLVSLAGHIICQRSIGYADFRTKKKLAYDSVFQIASLTKQFTALAIMILAEEGKLAYDHPVSLYLPELPYKGMTIRHLLNHTAGLPNYMWLVEHRWQEKRDPYNDDIVGLLAKYKPDRYFKAGTRFNYSNTGYVLLATIVEEVSGADFADFVRERIFIPLDMKKSFVYSRVKNRINRERLNGYYRRRGRYRINPETPHDGAVGDKGIFSTSGDLFKWDRALYTNRLVSAGTMERAFKRLRLKNGYRWHYGFGFRIKEFLGKKVVYHFGKWNSFQSCISRYIEDRHTIILLCNTTINLNHLEAGIRNILYTE